MHPFAGEPDLPVVGLRRARERLDQRRLPGAVVADDGEDLAREELEVRPVERNHVAVALHQPASLEDRLGAVHRRLRWRSWSTATARITSTPVTRYW
jgi:hypothetical protein